MTNRGKKIFLLLSVTVPFLLYCFYYYGIMVKNAPYKFSEFDHITFQYGTGDSLVNVYTSKNNTYKFLNKHDSLVTENVPLDHNDLLYLHRKAADLGFWDFPANETINGDTVKAAGPKVLRYVIEFAYKRKTKRVVFDAPFDGNERLKDANIRLIKEIQKRINDRQAELRK